jgi:hypothetical protein
MTRGWARTGAFFPGSGRRPIQHGTMGGYRAHYRHGDLPPCEPCKRAESERQGYKTCKAADAGQGKRRAAA